VSDLLSWWSRFHGCSGDSRLEDLQWAILTRLATDRMRFSEVFEPSCSQDGGGWHFWRFSYAFPDFRDDPDSASRDLLAVCRPFGEELCDLVSMLLSPVLEPPVCQPLVGVAYNTPTSWRIKVYLQFEDDAGDEPLHIAARLTGRTDLRRLFRKQRLHLVGIDLGPRGIVAAKLYFLQPEIPALDVPRVVGPVELIAHLTAAGVDTVRNLLVIHRMQRYDDSALEFPVEVDFALLDNDLCWEAVSGSRTLRATLGGTNPLTALESCFPVAVRRVSVSVGRMDKLTMYYVPTEIDTELPDGLPGC